MASGVVTIGRRAYAVGLYWENSPGKGRVAQIAREAALQPGMQADFYAVRSGNPKTGRVPQFGLCGGSEGQKAGIPALAACLAGQVPGSWGGAFRLPEGIIVTIIRDDLVVPDGDLLFSDELEARNRLLQEVGFGGLQAIYAPEAWAIPGSDSIPLALLLREKKDVTLRPIVLSQRSKVFMAAGLGVAILGLGGFLYWQSQAAEREAAAEQARLAAQALLPSAIQTQRPPEPKYERVWESSPPPFAVIENCRQGLALVPVAVPGWSLTSIKCAAGALTIAWGRTKGSATIPEGAALNETLTSATKTISLAPVPPRGAEALGDPDVLTERYLTQDRSLNLTKAPDDPPPPPPWVKRSFTFSVQDLPSDMPKLLADLHGVMLKGLSCNVSGGVCTWTIEGVIYENRK